MPMTTRRFSRALRPGSRGFMLLEALVGIVIFAIGVLGLVALQAAMTKAQTGSQFRAEAAFLASEVRGAMWADIHNLNNYDTSASCATLQKCKAWTDKVSARLPGGVGSIDVTDSAAAAAAASAPLSDGSFVVKITITWTPPNEETHTYVTSTTIGT